MDLNLVITVLKLYQEKKVNFKTVKDIIYTFTLQQIIFSPGVDQLLLSFFVKRTVDQSTSQSIASFLQQMIVTDLKLVANYHKSPQKTTDYLMGQIYRTLFKNKNVQKPSPQAVVENIRDFFADLEQS